MRKAARYVLAALRLIFILGLAVGFSGFILVGKVSAQSNTQKDEKLKSIPFCQVNKIACRTSDLYATPTKTPDTKKPTPYHQATVVTYHPSLTNTQATKSASLNADYLFTLVNEHRTKIGLAAFEKNDELCKLAVSRGPELPGEVASGNYHAGLYARNLPYWVTENMKYGGTEDEALAWWLNSPIHAHAINGDYKYSCTYTQGDIAIELFTNFDPK